MNYYMKKVFFVTTITLILLSFLHGTGFGDFKSYKKSNYTSKKWDMLIRKGYDQLYHARYSKTINNFVSAIKNGCKSPIVQQDIIRCYLKLGKINSCIKHSKTYFNKSIFLKNFTYKAVAYYIIRNNYTPSVQKYFESAKEPALWYQAVTNLLITGKKYNTALQLFETLGNKDDGYKQIADACAKINDIAFFVSRISLTDNDKKLSDIYLTNIHRSIQNTTNISMLIILSNDKNTPTHIKDEIKNQITKDIDSIDDINVLLSLISNKECSTSIHDRLEAKLPKVILKIDNFNDLLALINNKALSKELIKLVKKQGNIMLQSLPREESYDIIYHLDETSLTYFYNATKIAKTKDYKNFSRNAHLFDDAWKAYQYASDLIGPFRFFDNISQIPHGYVAEYEKRLVASYTKFSEVYRAYKRLGYEESAKKAKSLSQQVEEEYNSVFIDNYILKQPIKR